MHARTIRNHSLTSLHSELTNELTKLNNQRRPVERLSLEDGSVSYKVEPIDMALSGGGGSGVNVGDLQLHHRLGGLLIARSLPHNWWPAEASLPIMRQIHELGPKLLLRPPAAAAAAGEGAATAGAAGGANSHQRQYGSAACSARQMAVLYFGEASYDLIEVDRLVSE